MNIHENKLFYSRTAMLQLYYCASILRKCRLDCKLVKPWTNTGAPKGVQSLT